MKRRLIIVILAKTALKSGLSGYITVLILGCKWLFCSCGKEMGQNVIRMHRDVQATSNKPPCPYLQMAFDWHATPPNTNALMRRLRFWFARMMCQSHF